MGRLQRTASLPGAVGCGTPATHRPTAWVHRAVRRLQRTASLPRGSGPWDACNAPPHCLGAVVGGTPATHRATAWGQCAVRCMPHYLGAVGSGNSATHCLVALWHRVVELLQRTAPLPGGRGQSDACNALPHYAGAVGSGPPAMHRLIVWRSGQCTPCNALPHCMGAVGSWTPAMHRRTAWGQWAAELLQRTASLPRDNEQRDSSNALLSNALPHCLGAVGSATPAAHCLIAWGQWAVGLLQRTASLPGGTWQSNPCNALPHCFGAVGSWTAAMHCRTAWGQWSAELLQRTASLPGDNEQWDSSNALLPNALPHCLGAVGSATPAAHCLIAWGQWAVGLLQRTASLPGGTGQCNPCNALPHCLGAVGSLTAAMHCRTA